MSDVKKKRIRWTAANDSDIVAHRLIVAPEGVELTKDTTPMIEVAMPTTQVIAPDDFPEGTFGEDTNYRIGIFSVDDVGNTSDIAMVTSPFDFIAPGAPTDVIVENV